MKYKMQQILYLIKYNMYTQNKVWLISNLYSQSFWVTKQLILGNDNPDTQWPWTLGDHCSMNIIVPGVAWVQVGLTL